MRVKRVNFGLSGLTRKRPIFSAGQAGQPDFDPHYIFSTRTRIFRVVFVSGYRVETRFAIPRHRSNRP